MASCSPCISVLPCIRVGAVRRVAAPYPIASSIEIDQGQPHDPYPRRRRGGGRCRSRRAASYGSTSTSRRRRRCGCGLRRRRASTPGDCRYHGDGKDEGQGGPMEPGDLLRSHGNELPRFLNFARSCYHPVGLGVTPTLRARFWHTFCLRREALVRREARRIEGGGRPTRRVVAAAW